MREYVRNFPDNARWGDFETQMRKASEELVETTMARNTYDAAMELFDCMEALEGAMVALMQVSEPGVIRAFRDHYKKQRGRGDYVVL